MLRIKVELVPFGIEELTRTIATATIYNNGENITTISHDYDFILQEENLDWKPFKGTIKDYKRAENGRLQPVWRLIKVVLNQIQI